MAPILAGEKAPGFKLPTHKRNEVDSEEILRNHKFVVLSFHPMAWTPVCAQQMKDLEANHARFEELGAIAFGVSVDPVPTKHAWANELNIENTALLSDFWPHGGVAEQFGLFRENDGISERAVVILDSEGTVRFVKVYPIAKVPDIQEIIEAVEELS